MDAFVCDQRPVRFGVSVSERYEGDLLDYIFKYHKFLSDYSTDPAEPEEPQPAGAPFPLKPALRHRLQQLQRFLEAHRIAHRDLGYQNLLYRFLPHQRPEADLPHVVLTDFDDSKRYPLGEDREWYSFSQNDADQVDFIVHRLIVMAKFITLWQTLSPQAAPDLAPADLQTLQSWWKQLDYFDWRQLQQRLGLPALFHV
jgi:serine/threonine protein kinase